MTKLLAKVMEKIAELPEERQDDAAHLLLAMLANDAIHSELSEEQLREVDEAIADANAGKFASEAEISDVLHRPWA
jgi:predicted transcriptional regulator